MRLRMAAAAVALMAAGCGTSSDDVLADQFATISVEGCEAIGWEETSEATSDLPEGDRIHTSAANEDEAACGFGTHTWQRTEEQASESSPIAVIVVARRSLDDHPPMEGDLVSQAAKQQVSGAGQAEASSSMISPSHVLVAAVNEEYVGELPPGRLLRAAERDLGLDAGSPGRPRHR